MTIDQNTLSTDLLFTSAGRALTTTSGVGGTAVHYIPLALGDSIVTGYQVLGDGTIVCTVEYEFSLFSWADPLTAGATGVWKKDTTNVPDIAVTGGSPSGVMPGIGNSAANSRLKITVATNGLLKLGAKGKS
jgi:hypothetical protein